MPQKHVRVSAKTLRRFREIIETAPAAKGTGRSDKKSKIHRVNDLFRRFAHFIAEYAGSPWAFLIAVGFVIIWAVSGPLFNYSDTWQLTINTGTTIITFLIVFLIQNTQNRDAVAMHLKLDELIRAIKGARNQLIELEELSDDELEELHREFNRIHEFCEKRHRNHSDAGTQSSARNATGADV